MKQVILSCPTLKKEILHLIDELNLDTPVYFLPKRLHSNPPVSYTHLTLPTIRLV